MNNIFMYYKIYYVFASAGNRTPVISLEVRYATTISLMHKMLENKLL